MADRAKRIANLSSVNTALSTDYLIIETNTAATNTFTKKITVNNFLGNSSVIINIGANVHLTTNNLSIGNSTVNTLTNSTTFSIKTALPVGGNASLGILLSNTTFGIFFGSGIPTLAASQGSWYMRSDGSNTTNRVYINTDGNATWTAITTVG